MRAVVRSRDFVQFHQIALLTLANWDGLNFRREDAAAFDRTRVIQFAPKIGGVMPVRLVASIVQDEAIARENESRTCHQYW
jgi:hypothetical protein